MLIQVGLIKNYVHQGNYYSGMVVGERGGGCWLIHIEGASPKPWCVLCSSNGNELTLTYTRRDAAHASLHMFWAPY